MTVVTTVYWETQTGGGGGDITSTSRIYNAGELLTVDWVCEDNNAAGNLSILNSGTAQTWTPIAQTNANGDCKIASWRCVMNATQAMTISVLGDGGSTASSAIAVKVSTGYDAADPVPSGAVFSGTGGTDVTQSITPSAAGSDLWMVAGDWQATNSFVAAANCTLDKSVHVPGAYSGTLIRPTTQPVPDTAPFTIGESDAGGRVAWIAYQIKAAPEPAGVHRGPRLKARGGSSWALAIAKVRSGAQWRRAALRHWGGSNWS